MGSDHRTSEGEGGVPSRNTEAQSPVQRQDLTSWINWRLTLYVFVLGMICLVLAPLTSFWWLTLVFGAAVPVVLAMLDRRGLTSTRPDDRKNKERELLGALAERGELTPTTAAMKTSLTVDEASKILEELAGKGHLELQTEDGVMAYALRERDRRGLPDGASSEQASGDRAPQQLHEPLSERELEVLALLASGRTNAEISRDLFVAVGTVKSHINNIYRKLGAANRAEAVTRAREMRLLS